MRKDDSLWGKIEEEVQRWQNDSLLWSLSVFTASRISDLMMAVQQEQKRFKARTSFMTCGIRYKRWRIGLYTAQVELADYLFIGFGKGGLQIKPLQKK